MLIKSEKRRENGESDNGMRGQIDGMKRGGSVWRVSRVRGEIGE